MQPLASDCVRIRALEDACAYVVRTNLITSLVNAVGVLQMFFVEFGSFQSILPSDRRSAVNRVPKYSREMTPFPGRRTPVSINAANVKVAITIFNLKEALLHPYSPRG